MTFRVRGGKDKELLCMQDLVAVAHNDNSRAKVAANSENNGREGLTAVTCLVDDRSLT